MARIFIEGFEGRDRSLWQAVSDPTKWSIVNNDPDFKGYFLQRSSNTYGIYHAVLNNSYSEIYGAFKFKRTSSVPYDSNIMEFWLGNTSVAKIGVCKYPYKWFLERYNGTSFTSDEVCDLDVMYKIQFYIKTASSGGRLTLKVDDIQVIDYTGNTGTYSIGSFSIGGSYGLSFKIDDIILDDSEWPGDTRVVGLKAIGPGSFTSWMPSGGENYDNINDTPSDDSTFNWTNDLNLIDTFEFENLTGSILEVKAVQLNARVVKEGLPIPQRISFIVRLNNTNYEFEPHLVPTIKGPIYQCFNISPATSAAWTESEINSAEFGYKSRE